MTRNVLQVHKILEDLKNSEKFHGNFEKFDGNCRKCFQKDIFLEIFQIKPRKIAKYHLKNVIRPFVRNKLKKYVNFQRIRIKYAELN